jgi:DNA polymerase III subunit beta
MGELNMKLQVTQENLSRALSSVARIANTRGTLPVLANVLIKASGKRLSLSATNLDIAITHFVGSKIDNEGSTTVPARLMQDFVSSLPNGVIELNLDQNKLHIETDGYSSSINGIPSDEYPEMPALSKTKKSLSVPATNFKKALQQVVVAASSDESRPVLTAVYIHNHKGDLYVVATDSYRLAEKKVMSIDEDVSLLIPASSIQDLLRVMGDDLESVTITYDDQLVLFSVGDIELVTRLIDGQYPDYRKLLPSKFDRQADVSSQELLTITKVSSLFARESAGSVTITLEENNSLLRIKSVASQLGENDASAKGEIKGDGSITLNSKYIIDALSALDGKQVKMGFNEKLEPCSFTDPSDSTYVHIIMPLKS